MMSIREEMRVVLLDPVVHWIISPSFTLASWWMLVRRCEWSSLTQWLTGPSPLPIVIIDSSGELKHTEPQAAAETQNRIYMFTIFPRLFLYTFIFKKWKRLRCFLISSWQLFSSWSLGPFWLLWQKSHGLGGVQTADFLSCNSGVWESKVSSDRGPLPPSPSPHWQERLWVFFNKDTSFLLWPLSRGLIHISSWEVQFCYNVGGIQILRPLYSITLAESSSAKLWASYVAK